jgi:hypothetical protein
VKILSDLTKEQKVVFDAAMKEEEAGRAAQHKADLEVMAQAKGMLSQEDFEDLEAEVEGSDCAYDFQIVSEAKGDQWEGDYRYKHGQRSVNETSHGGMSGDDFAGDVYIPVAKNKWIKFSYA